MARKVMMMAKGAAKKGNIFKKLKQTRAKNLKKHPERRQQTRALIKKLGMMGGKKSGGGGRYTRPVLK